MRLPNLKFSLTDPLFKKVSEAKFYQRLLSGSASIATVIYVILACRGIFKALNYWYHRIKIRAAMRKLFFILLLSPWIALAGQVEQEEVD